MILKRIVVVDDEVVQRNVLSKILKKITPETEVVACRNGKDAYDEIQQNGADLLVTDICMPVMSGMALIQRISNEYPRVKIVLISAYQEFEYAREAIQYGVSEYLIKPFRVSDAEKLITRISEDLQKEKEMRKQLTHYVEMKEESRKQVQKKSLQALLNGVIDSSQLESDMKELQKNGVIVALRWKIRKGIQQNMAQLTKGQQEQLLSCMESTFQDGCFVPQEQGIDPTEYKITILLAGCELSKVVRQFKRIFEQLQREGIIFWVGISDNQSNLIENAADAFRQAEEVLSFFFFTPETGGIFEYPKLNHILEMSMISISSYEKEIRQAVCRGDMQKVQKKLSELKELLEQEPHRYPNKIKHRVSSMMVSIIKELEGMVIQADYDTLLNEAYKMFSQCDSFQMLFQISGSLLERVAGYFMKGVTEGDVVERSIFYIKDHLDEDLSLQGLADQVHFHPNYLSTQIKNRTGMSYSNYILSLRMERACKLLTETNLKVLDIACKCGFRESSYFNRVFRQEYEMSPEQYRKVHRKC